MTCTTDHSTLPKGEFCTECGMPAVLSEPAGFFASKRNQQITAVATVILLLIAGLVGYKVFKKSPAFPYLTSVCNTLNPVDFGKQNKAENQALFSSIQSDIEVAANLDAIAAAPFQKISSDLETIMNATDANNMQFALMLTLKTYSNIKSIQRELDRIIKLGETLEGDIDVACSSYTSQ